MTKSCETTAATSVEKRLLWVLAPILSVLTHKLTGSKRHSSFNENSLANSLKSAECGGNPLMRIPATSFLLSLPFRSAAFGTESPYSLVECGREMFLPPVRRLSLASDCSRPAGALARQPERGPDAADFFRCRSPPSATTGNTVKLTVQGLQPDTDYYYGVEVAGALRTEVVSRGRFRTFPLGRASFRIAFGSCGDFRAADQRVYDAIMRSGRCSSSTWATCTTATRTARSRTTIGPTTTTCSATVQGRVLSQRAGGLHVGRPRLLRE